MDVVDPAVPLQPREHHRQSVKHRPCKGIGRPIDAPVQARNAAAFAFGDHAEHHGRRSAHRLIGPAISKAALISSGSRHPRIAPAQHRGRLTPASRLWLGVFIDELSCGSPEGIGCTFLDLGAVAALGGGVVGDASRPWARWRCISAASARRRSRSTVCPALDRPRAPCRRHRSCPSTNLDGLPSGRRKRDANDRCPLGWTTRYRPVAAPSRSSRRAVAAVANNGRRGERLSHLASWGKHRVDEKRRYGVLSRRAHIP